MNWAAVVQGIIIGAAVSWPGTAVLVWVNWRKTRAHVDTRTAEQNELIEKITSEQTRKLLSARSHPAARPYHGHGDQDPSGGR